MIRAAVLCLGVGLALSACGARQQLSPAEGATLPPAPLGRPVPLSPSELLTPGVQARPGRGEDVLIRSEERRPDPFDIPPP